MGIKIDKRFSLLKSKPNARPQLMRKLSVQPQKHYEYLHLNIAHQSETFLLA